MKKLFVVFSAILIHSLVFSSDASAQGRGMGRGGGGGAGSSYERLYNPQTVETVSGVVVSVNSFTPIRGIRTTCLSGTKENARPIVKAPLRCVPGCTACALICPVEAITFPSKDELRAALRKLREETPTVLAGDRARNDERNSK